MSEPVLKYPEWQESYLAAMVEMHPESLKTKIYAAEAAIHRRAMDDNVPDSEERQAISDALSGLRALRKES